MTLEEVESSLRNEPEVDGGHCRRGKPGKELTPAYSEHLACLGTTRCDSGHRNTRSAVKSGGAVVQSSTVGLAVAGQSGMTQKRTLETQRRVLERLGQDKYNLGRGLDERGAVTLKQDLAGEE